MKKRVASTQDCSHFSINEGLMSSNTKKYVNKINENDYNIIAITDTNGFIEYVNDEFTKISGYQKDELIGASFKKIRHPETPGFIYQQIWSKISAGKTWEGILKNQNKQGKFYIVNSKIIPILNSAGVIVNYKSMSFEITDYIYELKSLANCSKHRISRLYNREVLIHDIEQMKNSNLEIAVIDIDNFKSINVYYGYESGDELVKSVSDKLKKLVSDEYKIYHIAIDEFVLVKELDSNNRKHSLKIYKNILDVLESDHLHLISGLDIDISLSIGVSFSTSTKIETGQLLKEADLALAYAKNNNVSLIDFNEIGKLNNILEERIKWIKEIRTALTNNNIVPWIQPIQDNNTGEITKCEALMRLIDTEDNVVSPFLFLDIAKKSKLYEKISYMMLDKTISFFSTGDKHFNINLTWADINSSKVKDMIFNYLNKYSDLGSRMTLEIVETESLQKTQLFEEFIEKVRKYGVKIALDDFGSGYSNFVYLEHLKVDYIKIDSTLITGMMEKENTLFLVESIVRIAKKFGIKTVAEFVATEAIQKKVLELGIDYSQGYYIAKPRPI